MLLLLFASLCCLASVHCDDNGYRIPIPTFNSYRPRGLRMSIPHESGIELVIFHVNVNQKVDTKEGDYTKYIVKASNGNWVYTHDVLRLKMGDKVYVRIVVLKDGLQHAISFDPFVVTDLQRQETETTVPPRVTSTTPRARPSTTTYMPTPPPPSFAGNCQGVLKNVTNISLDLEDKLEDARETIEVLKDLLPGPYFITISGTITQTYDDPYEVVNIALKRKLKLKDIQYKTCVRNGGHIVCELASIDDKIELVKCSKRNPAQSSQVRIIY